MAIVPDTFKFWIKENWADESFEELIVLDIQNLRSEVKGLGAGSATILLNDYDDTEKERFEGGPKAAKSKISYDNYWIFVQNTNLLDPESESDPENGPENNADPSIIWWGYIGDMTKELQLNTGDCRGTISLYEFGHYINKNPIRYTWINDNGFNPVQNDVVLGNKDPDITFSLQNTYQLQRNGNLIGINTTTDAIRYWTIKEIVGHLSLYVSGDIEIYPDFTNITNTSPGERNSYLNNIETVPSYHNESLNTALDQIFDSMVWYYAVSNIDGEDKVKIVFKDTNDEVNNTYIYVDDSYESITIMNEEQKWDKIILRGDRILFFNSLSTYTPMTTNKSIGVFPKWTDAERNSYISPLSPLAANRNIDQLVEDTKSKFKDVKNDETDSAESSKDLEISRNLGQFEMAREQYKNVYRDFKFGYCDPNQPTDEGDCLATWTYPGKYGDLSNEAAGASLAIPCFPNVKIQDDDKLNQFDDEGVQTKTPKDAIYTDPEIQVDDLTIHKTPPATEMKYVENLSNTEKLDKLREPTFFYRSLGRIQEFVGVTDKQFSPLWIDGTKSGNGLMSSGITLDYDGITLDVPAPECFATPMKYIYQDIDSTSGLYQETVKDFGVKRDDWSIENAGASKYDPYRRANEYRHIGHWGRMVFSFGSFSNQRLEIEYGRPGDRILYIEDDSYKMTVINEGYVYKAKQLDVTVQLTTTVAQSQQWGTTLNWNESPKIIKNDLSKMADRMTILWDFYSRDKRALRMVMGMFDTNGSVISPLGYGNIYSTVGTFLNVLTDIDGQSYEINSFVSSIEYDFNKATPRIIIQTEYPSSPGRTRQKVVTSAIKERK